MKRMTLFFLCLLTSIGWAMAQNRTVKGTVISSEDNEPLIGANVVVVGNTTIGAATDLDGNFTLSVPANAKMLRVSYSGMTTKEVAIANVMKIVLDPDSKVLEQVVVLGYGTGQKLSTVSGSVAKVSSEKLAEKPVANIMDALQGQVAGMQVMTSSGDPTKVANVTIHGTGSLGASSSPLYIVDGMQTDLSVVATMNPNDFDNVTVLKDASATSIYGARAANGVVIITTKRGKMGEAGRITFNYSYGVSSIISKKPMSRMMTGDEQLNYQFNNGYWDTTKPEYATIEAVKATLIKNAEDMYAKYPELAPLVKSGYLKPLDFDNDTDWLKYFIRPTAPTQQGDISFTGGSQGTSYFVSLGYFNQEGISREPSSFKRYSGRMNLESRIKEWLKLGLNLSGAIAEKQASSFSGTNYYNTGTFGALSMPKYLNPLTSDGEIADVYYIIGTTPRQSPLRIAKWYPEEDYTYQANVGGYLQFNPIKGLTIKSQAGLDFTDSRATVKTLPNNIFSPNPLGNRTERFYGGRLFTVTNTGEYKTNFEELHDVTILLGQEFIDADVDVFSARANGFENSKVMLLSQGKTGNFLQLPAQRKEEYAYLSFFGRGSYGFDKWMYLDVSLRNDQSSRFGDNNRSAWFYSFGSMFDIYNKFIKESDWLSDLRFKLSYGTTGNSEIGNYNHQALVGSNNYTDTALGLTVSTIGNPDLSWEKQSQLNVGIASGFWNNRLTAEVDFYVRTTDDMLINVPLQYISGFTNQFQNVGSMQNTGVDVNLRGTIFQNKDWNVYAAANFNYNRQKITKLFSGLDEYVLPNTGTIWQVGKPNSFYIAQYAGIYKGTEPYTDPDGNVYHGGDQLWYVPGKTWADGTPATTNVYSADLEQAVDKAVNPPITGGFSLGASWKGLLLDADFAYIIGKWMINNDRYFTENGSGAAMRTNKDKILLDAWTPQNPNSDVPRLGQDNQFDSRLLENASFLRLKNLKLTYVLPQSLFKTQGVVSGARVYLMARNLLTVTKYKGFDPEAGGNVALNQFPNTKQFVGGIQISF
ncbi:TonB-linked outer membrane protein RagA [Porphyromonas gingivalis]|uniref:TonB-linked outer membrane protein RagA n=1 Tax=Porphyromonas gingivalis TaxID=837 RepID=UPI0018E08B52|nr:TonB-dependent receptor [Porphyromonas gingivalis]